MQIFLLVLVVTLICITVLQLLIPVRYISTITIDTQRTMTESKRILESNGLVMQNSLKFVDEANHTIATLIDQSDRTVIDLTYDRPIVGSKWQYYFADFQGQADLSFNLIKESFYS